MFWLIHDGQSVRHTPRSEDQTHAVEPSATNRVCAFAAATGGEYCRGGAGGAERVWNQSVQRETSLYALRPRRFAWSRMRPMNPESSIGQVTAIRQSAKSAKVGSYRPDIVSPCQVTRRSRVIHGGA